jgi:hypothetical protein
VIAFRHGKGDVSQSSSELANVYRNILGSAKNLDLRWESLSHIQKALATDDCEDPDKFRIVLVQRKDTMAYVNIIRGKYPQTSPEREIHLETLFSEITVQERERLREFEFDQLWKLLWVNHTSRCFHSEYKTCRDKFNRIGVRAFLNKTHPKWNFTEFGIPKGKKNPLETDVSCAIREFCEETGYARNTFQFVEVPDSPQNSGVLDEAAYFHKKRYVEFEENFIGTDGVQYIHKYFLARMCSENINPSVDKKNKNQIGEISRVLWATEKQALSLLRDYDTEKKKVISDAFAFIRTYTDGRDANTAR